MEKEITFTKNDKVYQEVEDKTLVKLSMKNNIVFYETQFTDDNIIGVFYDLIKKTKILYILVKM